MILAGLNYSGIFKFSIDAQYPSKVYYANGEELSQHEMVLHDATRLPLLKLLRGFFFSSEQNSIPEIH